MSSADRRQAEILELLYMHEKCNVNDFVERFGVSRRTITSDIVVLTRKHNIKSKSGPHGGIEIDRDLKTDEVPYLTDFETSWLKRKYDEAEIEEDRIAAHSIPQIFFCCNQSHIVLLQSCQDLDQFFPCAPQARDPSYGHRIDLSSSHYMQHGR